MKKLILALGLALSFLSLSAQQGPSHLPQAANKADAVAAALKDPHSKYMVVVAHRGDWRNYPENSLPAIESIIQTDRPEFLIRYLESKDRR